MAEAWEERELSSLAALSKNSKGRVIPLEPCQVRTEFQRDRDRIVHSKSFRRLKDKTQVFIAPKGDHYRTRLTHTLEVAQIARTVARALRLNEDLVEAISLGHDLGHTPFGHAGETALAAVCPCGFTHNEQSLRLVEELEEGKGLNLTWEVRDGILNHTGDGFPKTLEGQIVRLVDRIAYVNHDLDDAIRAGIITIADLPQNCVSLLGEKHGQRINTMVQDLIKYSQEQPLLTMSEEIQRATNDLREFLFAKVYVGSPAKKEEDKAKRMLQDLFWFYNENPDVFKLEAEWKLGQDLKRQICDYIAGMTDRYAVSRYEMHFVPKGF
ncbi:MAG: deoxyguanosinetriphosphate triphosphohydrolase [Bacillota bacterium]